MTHTSFNKRRTRHSPNELLEKIIQKFQHHQDFVTLSKVQKELGIGSKPTYIKAFKRGDRQGKLIVKGGGNNKNSYLIKVITKNASPRKIINMNEPPFSVIVGLPRNKPRIRLKGAPWPGELWVKNISREDFYNVEVICKAPDGKRIGRINAARLKENEEKNCSVAYSKKQTEYMDYPPGPDHYDLIIDYWHQSINYCLRGRILESDCEVPIWKEVE